jgi:uncharacterized protein YjbI with pentapeptide repeats
LSNLTCSSFVSGAIFREANLRGAKLTGTNLSQADVSGANVRETYLVGTKRMA